MSLMRRMVRGTPKQRAIGDVLTLTTAFGGALSGMVDNSSGRAVTVESSLALPAVGSALRTLSRDVGSLPLITYRQRGDSRTEALNAAQYRMLRVRPNPRMPASLCWRIVTRHLVGWGQAFLGKEFDDKGRLKYLWPIRPEFVLVGLDADGRKIFQVAQGNGKAKTYGVGEILHVIGDSHDGVIGVSPIAQHRSAVGHALNLQEYGTKAIANRAVPTGALRIKKAITDPDVRKRLRAEWESLYKGSALSHKIAILDEDAEFTPLSIPLQDAQYIEQVKASIQDVARIFNVPASKLQGSAGDSLKYRNLESDQLDYLTGSLRPVFGFIEDALLADPDVFPATQPGLFCRFREDELLRLDPLKRSEMYFRATAGAAWMTPAEVRAETDRTADARFDYVPPPAAPPASTGGGDGGDQGGPNA